MLEPSLVTKIPFKQDSNYYYKHGLQNDNIHMDINVIIQQFSALPHSK